MPNHSENSRGLSFIKAMAVVFLPFAAGYFFSYLYRTINAVVAPRLRADLGIDASELGLLTAAYFIAFACCQVPLGVLLDRYGPRKVQGTLYAVAALGALLFSLGESVGTLMAARALIGVGVSGGLMAALKAIVQWFPREKIPLVNGWYLAFGGLGALSATLPVELALALTDWRMVFIIVAAGTLFASLGIWFVVPEKQNSEAAKGWTDNILGILIIYKDPFFWRLAPLMFTSASSHMAIQGLWAGPWLTEVNGYEQSVVAEHLLALAVGMIIGTTLQGYFAQIMARISVTISQACALLALLNIFALLAVQFQIVDQTMVLWLIVGLLGTTTSLVFSTLSLHFPESHAGRANTACNLFVFFMAFVYQYGTGAVINLWPQNASGAYPSVAYQTAFSIIVVTCALAIVNFLLMGRLAPRSRGLPLN